MKKKSLSKRLHRYLILFTIDWALLTVFFGYVSFKNDEYQKEYEKLIHQTYQEDEDQLYGRKVDKPLYYHVLVDTRKSMLVNFDNFENHLKDELIEMAALLTKKDYLAVYMMNEDTEKIILSGETEFEKNAQLIRELRFTFDDTADVDHTVTNSDQAFADLHDAYYTRRVIITDRSAVELKNTVIGKEKKVHWANMTDIVVSDNNMISGYPLLDEVFYVHTLGSRNSFVENILSDEFFFAFNKLTNFSTAFETGQRHPFGISVKLPQQTDRLIVILSEDNMLLTKISPGNLIGNVYGTTLSDGKRILVLSAEEASDAYKLEFNFGQSGTFIYASDHGYPIESLDYLYMDGNWTWDWDLPYQRYNSWILASYWRKKGGIISAFSTVLGIIGREQVRISILLLLGLVGILLAGRLIAYFKQRRLRAKQTVFISYRRNGSRLLAHAINEKLQAYKIQTFMDTENLSSGDFEQEIINRLKDSACVVLVLPVGGLDACLDNKDDWIRKEISLAIKYKIQIIPVLEKDFKWPSQLPEDMEQLRLYNAIPFEENFYSRCMQQVVRFVMNILEKHGMEFDKDKLFDEEEDQNTIDEEFYTYARSRSSKDSKDRDTFIDKMLNILKLSYEDDEFFEDDTSTPSEEEPKTSDDKN